MRRTLEGVLGVPATEGNAIDPLRNGDAIFPAMLEAIDHAEHTIDFRIEPGRWSDRSAFQRVAERFVAPVKRLF